MLQTQTMDAVDPVLDWSHCKGMRGGGQYWETAQYKYQHKVEQDKDISHVLGEQQKDSKVDFD